MLGTSLEDGHKYVFKIKIPLIVYFAWRHTAGTWLEPGCWVPVPWVLAFGDHEGMVLELISIFSSSRLPIPMFLCFLLVFSVRAPFHSQSLHNPDRSNG